MAAKLGAFVELLRRWNRTVNLVAGSDLQCIYERHIDDSLQLVDLIPANATHGIDLGSGAGFPGLMLSIATGIPFLMIEADQRKCAFLREAARVTGAPAEVRTARMETVIDARAPLITARGIGTLGMLLPIVARLLTDGGSALLPRGRERGFADNELQGWSVTLTRHQSHTRAGSVILELRDVRRVA